jgi:hypothetical protein
MKISTQTALILKKKERKKPSEKHRHSWVKDPREGRNDVPQKSPTKSAKDFNC